jgi:DNA repair protein RadC
MNYRIPAVKLSMVRDGSVLAERRTVTSSAGAAAIIRMMIGGNDREEFVALLLDAKHKVVAVHSVAVGSLTMAIVHPREVFKAAIVANASAVIVAHNHPSGDPMPSAEDHELTKRLVAAGKLIGIAVLDHVVIGDEGRMYSFADQGALDI